MCSTTVLLNQNFFSTVYVLTRRFIVILNVVLLISLISTPINSYAQGKLNQSKEEIKKGRNNKSNTKENSSRKRRSKNSIIGAIFTEAFWFIAYHTFIGNPEYEHHLQNDLSRHPYFNGACGNYKDFYVVDEKEKKIRFDVENSVIINFDQTFGNHLNMKIRPSSNFYLQGNFLRLIEVPTGNNSVSTLSLQNFDICYDRLRFEEFNLGWSVGFNYIGDEVKVNRVGFSLGFSAEYFFSNPLSISSSYRFGAINGVPVDQFDIKLKYYNSRFFYLLGYEYYKLATPKYGFIAMGIGLYL